MDQVTFRNEQASMPLNVCLDLICNTPVDTILSNVLTNSKPERQWVGRTQAHGRKAVVCGSGPSIADYLEQIKQEQQGGAVVFALNGAASYLSKNGILADFQIIMDARPCTLEVVGEAENHLFASQVDPSLFAAKPDAIVWHATYGDLLVDQQDGFPVYDKDYCLIGGFSSVGNTSLILLFAMGYRDMLIYGLDSSHHLQAGHVEFQSINNDDFIGWYKYNEKYYMASLTMMSQADSFIARAQDLIRHGCKLDVRGYGLLPDMWKTFNKQGEKHGEA